MAAAYRCPACGFESDSFADLACSQCGKKCVPSGFFWHGLPRLVLAVLVTGVMTGLMFAFHFPRPMMLFSALTTFLMAALGLRPRMIRASSPKPLPPQLASRPMSAIVLDLSIAILGLAFVCCLLFGFVIFMNAHTAFERVQGQPYHAATFQVIRPYYQKSPGMHGPQISAYASGIVEGKKEWMSLFPYFKRYPRDQAELNDLLPPGTVIPVYLLPNLKGRSRIEVIDVLPPGEASRRTEVSVLRRVPVALAILGGLIFLLVRIRRSYAAPAAQSMTASCSS
jgi:hypothetical protein